jgi:hypothetical protein
MDLGNVKVNIQVNRNYIEGIQELGDILCEFEIINAANIIEKYINATLKDNITINHNIHSHEIQLPEYSHEIFPHPASTVTLNRTSTSNGMSK